MGEEESGDETAGRVSQAVALKMGAGAKESIVSAGVSPVFFGRCIYVVLSRKNGIGPSNWQMSWTFVRLAMVVERGERED